MILEVLNTQLNTSKTIPFSFLFTKEYYSSLILVNKSSKTLKLSVNVFLKTSQQ